MVFCWEERACLGWERESDFAVGRQGRRASGLGPARVHLRSPRMRCRFQTLSRPGPGLILPSTLSYFTKGSRPL